MATLKAIVYAPQCTAEVVRPTPPTEDSEPILLKDSGIKFTVKNRDGTRKSNLLPEGTTTDPKDLEGHIQPLDTGLQSIYNEGIRSSKPLPEGKPSDANDREGNTQPAGMGSPATHPNDGIIKSKPFPKGTFTDLNTQGAMYNSVTGVCLSQLVLINQVDPDTKAPVQTLQDYELLIQVSDDELKELSDEEMFEAEQPHHTESSHPESQPKPSKFVKKKVKKSQESDQSPKPSNSKSSSCSESFKPYDKYMPVTERVLARNLQGFSEVLYAQVAEDNWEKHEETIASYADLNWSIEYFYGRTCKKYEST
ncbi:hypothetical protein Tco_1297450 [Tanacetum coccineum]